MRMPDHVFNRVSVLKKLRAAEPVTRTELARLAGLNGGTITVIVRDLVERGLIREERQAATGRGRPKVDLRINPEGAFVVGATMTDNGRLIAEIADLRGQSVATGTNRLEITRSIADLASQFARLIDEVIGASPVPRAKIAQIGIGLPAMVNADSGVVEFFETLEGLPFAFGDAIERALAIPTRVDNNIALLARAEHWFGDGAGIDDFTLVLVDLGLGAARYQAGELVIGAHSIAAEFGHTKIVPEGGRPCHCGGEGCLQAYSSISAIVYQAAEEAGEPRPAIFELRRRFRDIVARAGAGDAALTPLFERAGRYLGRGVANHVNMQDPDRIILLTQTADLIDLISPWFFAAFERDTLPALRDRGRVTIKRIDQSSFARGAAAMVLERLYRTP